MKPVIISSATSGGIHTPGTSEHLPITPDQITEAAVGAPAAFGVAFHA